MRIMTLGIAGLLVVALGGCGGRSAASSTSAVSATTTSSAYEIGNQAGHSVIGDLDSLQHPSEHGIFTTFTGDTRHLRPVAREWAAVAAVQYTRELERGQSLPAGSTDHLVAQMVGMFPSFRSFLHGDGARMEREIARDSVINSALHSQIAELQGATEPTPPTQVQSSSSSTTTATSTATPSPSPSRAPVTPAQPVESPGSTSHATDDQFCSAHACIENFPNGNGYIVQCSDGEWSHSGGLRGACSDHGGEQ
jgi:hypothetical protein